MSLASVEAIWALADAVVPVVGTTRVAVTEAWGHVLAEDVLAVHASPGADVSVMDGYAVRSVDLDATPLTIVGESAAGRPFTGTLAAGQAVRIATGACVPMGADMVVAQEDTRVDARALTVALDRIRIAPGRFVRPRGADVRPGDRLVAAGTRLGVGEVALLAAAGHAALVVHRRPRVAILSSGDELVAIGTTPAPGQVVSTNGLMLALQSRQAGADVVAQREVADDIAAFDRALVELAEVDLLLTSGGASVGDHDLVRTRLAAAGGRELAWGVAMRPGKPLGVVDRGGGRWALALPGNPASSLVTAELFARPWIRRLGGERGDVRPQPVVTRSASALPGAGDRDHFVRVRHGVDGVVALADQSSGNLRSFAGADALARVPAGRSIAAGETCEVLSLAHLVGGR